MTNEYGTWQVNEAEPKAEAEDTEEGEDWYEEDESVGTEAQTEEKAEAQTLDQPSMTRLPNMTNRERIYRAIESHGPLKATAAFEEANIGGTQGYGILRSLEEKGLIKREVDAEGTTRFRKGLDWDAVSHTRGRKPGSGNSTKAKPVAAKRNATKPSATVKQAVGTPTIVGMAIVFTGDKAQTYWRGSDGKTYRVEEVEQVTL